MLNRNRRSRSRLLKTLALAALGWVLAGGRVEAKNYRLPSIEITARIRSSGELDIEERIQYRFSGRYSSAYRTIPLLPGERIQGLSVREEGILYRPGTDEEPSTFTTSGEDSGLEVHWYFKARDETRTFVVNYTLTGAVHRYSDIAELHYTFLGSGWRKSIGRLQARVEFPPGSNLDGVQAWVRDPVRGSVRLTGDSVRFSARNWPRRSAFSGRVLFPAAAVPGLPVEGSGAMAESIRQAEERAFTSLLRQEEHRQQWETTLWPWMFILPLATWLVWYLLFLQHGRRHQATPHVPAGHLPDQDPLFARWVYSRSAGRGTLVAALFDLARRGYFQIQEEKPADSGTRGKPKRDYYFQVKKRDLRNLRPFERALVDFLTGKVGDGMGFRISDLQRMAKKSPSRFQKWFNGWSRLFKEEARAEEIFEPRPVGAMVSNFLLGLFTASAGASACLALSSPVGLPAVILGGGQMLFTGTLRRRTHKGERLLLEWKAFRSHLKKRQPVSLESAPVWDSVLIGAVSLELVDEFNRLLGSTSGETLSAPWFSSIQGDSHGFASLSSDLQSMVHGIAVSAAATAGAAGAGAAASGGGGGGAS